LKIRRCPTIPYSAQTLQPSGDQKFLKAGKGEKDPMFGFDRVFDPGVVTEGLTVSNTPVFNDSVCPQLINQMMSQELKVAFICMGPQGSGKSTTMWGVPEISPLENEERGLLYS